MTENEKKTIDLSGLDTVAGANAGFDVMLFHPGTREDLGIIFKVVGKDSDKFQEVSRAQQKRRLNKMSKGGFRSATGSLSPEEMENESIDLLAACTLGWSDNFTISGEAFAFSTEAAKRVYKQFPWIKEQIDEAMGDRSNFIKR